MGYLCWKLAGKKATIDGFYTSGRTKEQVQR
jgi:hypothetical protein